MPHRGHKKITVGTKNNWRAQIITVGTLGTNNNVADFVLQSQMDKVKVLLDQANLVQYLHKFERAGYDCLAQILSMSDAAFTELGQHTEILPGHLARLRQTITRIKNCVPTPKPVEASVHVKPQPVEASKPHPVEASVQLKIRHLTRKELRLASLQHSTNQGCKCMIDNDKSGGRNVIYKCTSVLSKKRKADCEDDPRPSCQYRLHWGWNKRAGFWELKTKKSHLMHMPFCTSVQRVSKLELVNDPKFVKHCKSSKKVTGKNGAKEALGGPAGRVAGSVKNYTAKRAVNDIKHFWIHDYKHDWNKLRSWGREYERKNPRAKCHIEVDSDGR